jgi:hypothetical protein
VGGDHKDELVAGRDRCGDFGPVWCAERYYLMILIPRRVPSSCSERLVEARHERHVLSRIRQENSGQLHLRPLPTRDSTAAACGEGSSAPQARGPLRRHPRRPPLWDPRRVGVDDPRLCRRGERIEVRGCDLWTFGPAATSSVRTASGRSARPDLSGTAERTNGPSEGRQEIWARGRRLDACRAAGQVAVAA